MMRFLGYAIFSHIFCLALLRYIRNVVADH